MLGVFMTVSSEANVLYEGQLGKRAKPAGNCPLDGRIGLFIAPSHTPPIKNYPR